MANPFQTSSLYQRRKDRIMTLVMALLTYAVVGIALLLFGWITVKGMPVLFERGFEFFTKSPQTLVVFEDEAGKKVMLDFDDYSKFKDENPEAVIRNEHTHSYSGGGIKGPLLGTALLMVVCMTTALFIGISASIYLSEYAKQGKFVSIVRLAIVNLAGVPSIVYGLFGFAFFCVFPWWPVITRTINEEQSIGSFQLFSSELFVSFQGWGSSLLAGGLTLAIMVLPVIIAACEESLKAVPKGFREASCALGATRWQCIRTAVLPFATPGILTASVLGITRVAGETAPIMFTAAVALKGRSPFAEPATDGGPLLWISDFFTQSVQAMPYHIYTVSARIPRAEGETTPMQDGSVFVFLLLVMLFSTLSIWLRIHFRNKLKW